MKLVSMIILLSSVCFAQVSPMVDEMPAKTEKELIMEEIQGLKAEDSAELASEIEKLNSRIVEFAQTRKKQCYGEYSTIEITPEGESKKVVNKLSKEEKKLCMINLIQMRKRFSKALFKARKELLVAQHKEQVASLERAEKETLKELDEMASKLK